MFDRQERENVATSDQPSAGSANPLRVGENRGPLPPDPPGPGYSPYPAHLASQGGDGWKLEADQTPMSRRRNVSTATNTNSALNPINTPACPQCSPLTRGWLSP